MEPDLVSLGNNVALGDCTLDSHAEIRNTIMFKKIIIADG